jgi:hypothetical protein
LFLLRVTSWGFGALPQWALSRYWISIQKPTSILQSINQVSFKERSWLSSFPTKSCPSRPLQPLATA